MTYLNMMQIDFHWNIQKKEMQDHPLITKQSFYYHVTKVILHTSVGKFHPNRPDLCQEETQENK